MVAVKVMYIDSSFLIVLYVLFVLGLIVFMVLLDLCVYLARKLVESWRSRAREDKK